MFTKLNTFIWQKGFLTVCLFLILSNIATTNVLGQHLSRDPGVKGAKPKGPVMTIRGKGVEVENGDTITKRVNNTDFGQVEVFGAIPKHRFTIKNTGDEILQMRNPGTVQLKGTDSLTFRVEEQPDSRLSPGDSTSFLIQFDPDTQKLQTATVEIPSNDSSRSPFTFRISGQGAPYTNVEQSQEKSNFKVWQSGDKLHAVVPESTRIRRQIRLIGIKGVTYWEANLPSSKTSVRVPTNGLEAGVYIVAVQGSEEPLFQKVIIR